MRAIEEKKSLIENETWELFAPPKDGKILDTKWVFRTKKNASGEIIRHKTRLVVCGCKQTKGINYQETYSPVIRYTTIRFLCALVAKFGLKIHQLNVVTVYLHGEIDGEVYVQLPPKLQDPNHRGRVWKLKTAIYGLKQSGRLWNRKLDQTQREMQLEQSRTDPCVYFKREGKQQLILGIYVDDIIVLSNSEKLLRAIKQKLAEKNSKLKI